MTAAGAAQRWADTWQSAWAAHDADAIAAFYAPGARFRSAPFRELQEPRAYVELAFGSEERTECRFGEPLVSGDRAVVEWWAVVETRDEGVQTLAGASLLRFGDDGLVVEQRDYWHLEPGRREPPDDFGR